MTIDSMYLINTMAYIYTKRIIDIRSVFNWLQNLIKSFFICVDNRAISNSIEITHKNAKKIRIWCNVCTRNPELVRKMPSSTESTNSEHIKMADVVCKNAILLQLSRCKYLRLCLIMSVQIHHVISPKVSSSRTVRQRIQFAAIYLQYKSLVQSFSLCLACFPCSQLTN